jgi:hypothetical protein
MSTHTWFEVDKDGLAKLREGAPKSALVEELVQNAWDTNATYCAITLQPVPGTRNYDLTVEDDDPQGFTDLAHAYTLFAESEKKGDAEKRGRFNLGEKLVLALCSQASITSTKGTIVFGKSGRWKTSIKTEKGSRFVGTLKLTKAEADEIREAVFRLLPPPKCTTTYNGIEVPRLTVLKSFETILPTVISDAEGNLRPTKRKCVVEVFQPQIGAGMAQEPAMIYEMGIPVVETGDRWHYNVQQKVPLTLDRSNVTPAFLREIREAVAEAMLDKIEPEDAQATWVRVAAANPDASRDLVHKVFTARFGDDAVIYDPNDMEANKRAMNDGRTVVMGGHMSKEEWGNVRVHGIAAAAGKVYTDHKIETSPDGTPWKMAKTVTPNMEKVANFAKLLAHHALGVEIEVQFVSEPTMRHMAACYGGRLLRYNVGTLGYEAFSSGLTLALLDLTIHELAHEKALDHWSDAFYKACTMIGAKAVTLALMSRDIYAAAGLCLSNRETVPA